jgi:hypothetical protein
MFCGICKAWKVALEYTFCKAATPGEILQLLIIEVIRKIRTCNFEVVASTCDQGLNNKKALRMLGASVKHPYFYVDDIRVYSLFDVPHLMKTQRNGLKKYNIKIRGKTVKWIYIKKLWQFETAFKIKISALEKRYISPLSGEINRRWFMLFKSLVIELVLG